MKTSALKRLGFAFCASLGLAGPAPAQVSSSATAASRWEVDYGEYRCALSRRFGQDTPVNLSIRIVPGLETAELIVVDPGWPRSTSLPSRVRVVLGPSESSFEGTAQSAPVPSAQHRFMRVSEISRGFFESLRGSNRLVIEGDGHRLLSIDLTQSAQATQALRACHDDLIRGWGIDPVVAAAVSRRPVPLGRTALFVGSSDPITGPEAAQSSFLIIRYTVAVNGRISACEVVRETGRTGLGPMYCNRARQDARFEPAIGPDNQPVPFQLVQTIALVRRPSM